jgi:hypothetical protein
MTRPQEQFAELAHRTQENFKHLWEQWNTRSTELMKGVGGRSQPTGAAAGNPEEVLDAVFDFAENLIAQQRAFAKQMLKAASQGQAVARDTATDVGLQSVPGVTGPPSTATGMPGSVASSTHAASEPAP